MIKKKIANPLSIKAIHVEKLFGFYSYEISSKEQDVSKLLILYGDNGSGKTTILKILFYLLSTREHSGFKSKLAQIKFKKFSVLLENGIEIGAVRSNMNSESYTYYIHKKNKPFKSVFLKSNENGSINISKQNKDDQQKFQSIIDYIINLKIHTFFLTDDRKIHSSLTSTVNEHEEELNEIVTTRTILTLHGKELISRKNPSAKSQLTIGPAIERLLDWIRNKTISGSKIGEKNSQVIFSDIINAYINLAEQDSVHKGKDKIVKELDEIEKIIPAYVELGLIENFETKKLRDSIRKATTEEQTKYLATIISPFLEGINAKLKALEKVEQTVNLFISIVNDYFSNKKLQFNLGFGFTLSQTSGEHIDFDWLSSGEKQLLLLLINTITSSDDATVFIIDEPEISLNIKWQRKLIKTLLNFSSEKNIQFILATHSIELLSANKLNVSKLENSNERI